MNLPTGNPTFPESVGMGAEGGNELGTCVAALDCFVYQDMRWCVNCGGAQIFVEVFEFEGGRLGVCLGCGQERCVAFSREVAE